MAQAPAAVTWDHERLKHDRLALLQAEMQRQDIGALYLTEGFNVRYLIDVKVPFGQVFVPAEGTSSPSSEPATSTMSSGSIGASSR